MIFKKLTTFILSVCISFSYICGVKVFAEDNGIAVNARGAVLIEPSTGQILLEQNKDEKHPLASVTKIMTMVLIYDAVKREQIKWDDVVTVSSHASSMGGSQVFLEENEQQTVRELTKCIAIASANDASVAMAEFIGGSEEGFVKMMNDKCIELEMTNTHFVNACGLDADNHYSTAYDIAKMSRYLMNNYPDVTEFTTTWQDTIIHKTAKGSQEFGLNNTNKLIRTYNGATGLKTGSTSDALYCVSASASRDNMNLIAVILGAPDPSTRFSEAIKLLDYGFFNYTSANGLSKGEVMGEVPVYKGTKGSIPVEVKDSINLVVGKGKDRNLESEVSLITSINAPVDKGIKAGEVIYSFEGKEVGRVDLITSVAVEKATLKDIMEKLLIKWI